MTEDQIFYPGSQTIGQTANDETGLDAPGPDTGWVIGTSATSMDVLGFYQRELSGRGWAMNSAAVIRGTSEDHVYGWTKNRLVFRLGFNKSDDPRNPGRDRFPTVYSIDLYTEQ